MGAGASYGDSLKPLDNLPTDHLSEWHPHQTPLAKGFFHGSLVEEAGYSKRLVNRGDGPG